MNTSIYESDTKFIVKNLDLIYWNNSIEKLKIYKNYFYLIGIFLIS